MPVIKYSQLKFAEVDMTDVKDISGLKVVGPMQGWKDYTLRVFRIGPGGFSPHHQHDWEHINYFMKGRGQLLIGNQSNEVARGDFAFVPPNTIHQFRNPYEEDLEFICIVPNRGA